MLYPLAKELFEKYNDYDYFATGYDQTPHYCQNSAEWDKWSIMSNPALFEQLKGGSCWDYCTAQADFFRKNRIPSWHYCLICEQTPDEKERGGTPTTHTFTIIQGTEPDEFYYFEQSFKKKKGIYGPYASLNDALYSTFKWLCKNNPNHVKTLELHIHNPLNKNTYGMDSHEYLKYMKQEPLLWAAGDPLQGLLHIMVT